MNSFEVEFALSGLDEILQSGIDHYLTKQTFEGFGFRTKNPFANKAEQILKISPHKRPMKCPTLQKLFEETQESEFVRKKSKELFAKFANFTVHGKR